MRRGQKRRLDADDTITPIKMANVQGRKGKLSKLLSEDVAQWLVSTVIRNHRSNSFMQIRLEVHPTFFLNATAATMATAVMTATVTIATTARAATVPERPMWAPSSRYAAWPTGVNSGIATGERPQISDGRADGASTTESWSAKAAERGRRKREEREGERRREETEGRNGGSRRVVIEDGKEDAEKEGDENMACSA